MIQKAGDYLIHPSHGLTRIKRIEQKRVGSVGREFYILQGVTTQITLIVPTNDPTVRPVMSKEIAQQLLERLGSTRMEVEQTTWNRRYREWHDKLCTGTIENVSFVYIALNSLREIKELSFGERKMFQRATDLLSAEIGVAVGISMDSVELQITGVA